MRCPDKQFALSRHPPSGRRICNRRGVQAPPPAVPEGRATTEPQAEHALVVTARKLLRGTKTNKRSLPSFCTRQRTILSGGPEPSVADDLIFLPMILSKERAPNRRGKCRARVTHPVWFCRNGNFARELPYSNPALPGRTSTAPCGPEETIFQSGVLGPVPGAVRRRLCRRRRRALCRLCGPKACTRTSSRPKRSRWGSPHRPRTGGAPASPPVLRGHVVNCQLRRVPSLPGVCAASRRGDRDVGPGTPVIRRGDTKVPVALRDQRRV